MKENDENQLENTNDNQRKLTRRGFLKWTTALAVAGAAVVGIGAGYGSDLLLRPTTEKTTTATTTKTGTITVTQPGQTATTTKTVTAPVPTLSYVPPLSPIVQDRVTAIISSQVAIHAGDTINYTSCGLNCMIQCLLKVHSKNGIVTSIEGDDTVNPNIPREDVGLDKVKTGLLQDRPCALGVAWQEKAYSPTRVLYPMKLVGPKGSGQYQRITWTEALDTIYSKMTDAINKYGPYSVLSIIGDGAPFYSLLGGGVSTWGEQSYSGTGNPEILMEGMPAGQTSATFSEADVFNSKLILLIGRLPPVIEGQGGQWSNTLLLAKESGIPFILIDPRYTVVHRNLNAQWIPIKPGTDSALLLAMAYIILSQDLYDHNFASQWVEPTGFAKWKDYVLGASDGIPRTPQWAEKLCGIPADTITALTNLYVKSKPTKLLVGWENTRSTAMNISRLAIGLQALMGYLTVPGGGEPFSMGYTKNPYGTGPFPAAASYGATPGTYVVPVMMNVLKWQKAILLRPKVDSGQLSEKDFNGLIGNLASNPAPNIKVAGFRDNQPVDRFGANERLLATKQVFTWGRYWYIDTSSRYMDIILPSTETALEDPGKGSRFITNTADTYNRFAYISPAMAPLGEARPDNWIWLMLAKRAGKGQQFNPVLNSLFQKDEWDFTKYNQAVENAHKASYMQWAADPKVAPSNPPSWDDFKKKPAWRWPATTAGPFQIFVDQKTNPFANTASQKLEFRSALLADPAIAASQNISKLGWGGYMYSNICLGKIGPGATDIPTWVNNVEYTVYDPQSKNYPLLVISPNSYYRSHSTGFNISLLNGDCYKHRVWISVVDASKRGIKDNDLVRVFSPFGEMILAAYVTSRIMPGVVAIYHGGYYRPGGVTSALQPDGIDRGGAMNLLLVDMQPGTMINGPCIGSGPVEVQKL